jgi:valyl-tRNA synthetase
MPFVTEELWGAMADGERDHYPLITAKWPAPEAQVDQIAKARMEWIIDLVSEVRALRAELTIPWTSTLTLHRLDDDDSAVGLLRQVEPTLQRMAKATAGDPLDAPPPGSAQIVVGGVSYAVPLGDAIDLDAERARLQKAVETAEKDRDGLAARLGNANFTERAKPEAVAKAREDHAARAEEAERLAAALARLG